MVNKICNQDYLTGAGDGNHDSIVVLNIFTYFVNRKYVCRISGFDYSNKQYKGIVDSF